jgi:hypothetical protein
VTDWQPVVDEVLGRLPAASNLTLLGRVGDDPVVYKPITGNRPLWDFDVETLAAREVLTYLVARKMGFDLVPETALGDGPLGPGAVQRFVEEDPGFDPVPMIRRADPDLWPVALLDLVANNADRKAGHLLRDIRTGGLRSIDHGLTFHPDPKLRTVLWVFAGDPLPPPMRLALGKLLAGIDEIGRWAREHLSASDAAALADRAERLADDPVHPEPPTDRPPVPWPPF